MKTCLETNRLRLVVLTPQYAFLTLKFYEENKGFLEPFEEKKQQTFFTEIYQTAILKAEQENARKGSSVRFWIFLKEDEALRTPVGTVALSQIIRGPFQSCFVGYKTDFRHINKGYMTEALQRVLDYAFAELKLHRMEATVMPNNAPSLKVLTKVGFIEEGYSKKYLRINGIWEDHVRLAKLNESII